MTTPPEPSATPQRVGPGQRNHNLSDGCVPSHTSQLSVCYAEIADLRDRLALAEQQIAFERKLADAASNSVDQLTQKLALAEQALEQAGHHEDRLRARVKELEAGIRKFLDPTGPEAFGLERARLDETTPMKPHKSHCACRNEVDRLRTVVGAARLAAAEFRAVPVNELRLAVRLTQLFKRLDETTPTIASGLQSGDSDADSPKEAPGGH